MRKRWYSQRRRRIYFADRIWIDHTLEEIRTWEKRYKKKYFQGIHDRFIRDPQFCWRRWDALADEDHTHQLTAQEYLDYKRKWWLHWMRRGDISQRKWHIYFRIEDGRIELPEEIRNWEHPPNYGNVQFEERVILTFENQKGLFHNLKTHFGMPVKQLMISGPCQETSYTAVTLNPESNITRWEKNHSLFHWSTLKFVSLSKTTSARFFVSFASLEACWTFSTSVSFSKDNTSQVHFRSVNLFKEVPYWSESEQVWCIGNKWIRHRATSPTTCRMNLMEIHEYIQWLVGAVDWATAELLCFCSHSSSLSVSASLDFFLNQTFAHCLGSRAGKAHVRIHPILHAHVSSCCECCSWSLRLLHSLLLFPHHLSDHFAVPTARHLQLPRCGGQIPCALPRTTLAPWRRTSLPQVQSGLDESWWADSMACFSYLRNVTDSFSDGKTPYERRFGQPFKKTYYSIWFIG